MLFLIRSAFWLLILVLLLPTDSEQQSQIWGTAQSAVHDVATFCDRNPQTCATGQDAFAILVQKAEFGAQMVMGVVEQQTGASGTNAVLSMSPAAASSEDKLMPVPPAAAPLEPTTWEMDSSQDTLSPEDREAAWGVPDAGA
ncbi:MAG: DUF5330 domain-containing protein [Methyloceanibacter sp.]